MNGYEWTKAGSLQLIPAHQLSENDLLSYNQEGLIPGPNETEEAFSKRVQACLSLKTLLTKEMAELPFKPEMSPEALKALESAYPLTLSLFDIKPAWLPLFFSNSHLAPWHGGCAWIFQLETHGPRLAFLQLRKTFAKKSKYLSIYQRNELIAHESAHVGRMMFDESRFEEVLAYRTHQSRWRAWLGPLVQSATESLIFIGLILILLLLDVYFLLTENYEAYYSITWLKLLPLGLFCLALIRLWRLQRIFERCLSNLKSAVGNQQSANHIIYRLSDREIELFAVNPSDSIVEYAQKEREQSPRWRLIWAAYFQKNNK